MKKALLVTIDFPPAFGGVAAYWQRVAGSLAENRLVVLAPPAQGSQEASNVIRRPLAFRWLWPRWLRAVWAMWRVYKQQACNVIVAAQVLPIGTAAYVLHKVCRIPYAVQVYGMDLALASQSARKRALVKRILSHACSVVVNSQATRELAIESGADAASCIVVYPIPPKPEAISESEENIRARYGLVGKKVVLTVGRLVARKGQDVVIQAMKRMRRDVPECVYVVVGDGPDRARLENLAGETGEPVMFLGSLPQKEKNALFHVCDVFVMPSRSAPDDVEGFGMVFLEAGAFGKPVIGGRSGGVSEAVIEGQTGLLVDPESVPEVGEAIVKVLTDQVLAETLGRGGKAAWQNRWDWDKEMQHFEKIFGMI